MHVGVVVAIDHAEAMRLDDAILASLEARWAARGWPGPLPETNRNQAMIPDGATILENRHGSAPGIWLEDDRGRWVAMLPGVPREFRGMTEDALLTGPLEPTNEPYAIAKIAGIKLCESYNRQYGTDYRSVMPTNLYGPGDNYHPENSHVIPALLRRFHEAKLSGADTITMIDFQLSTRHVGAWDVCNLLAASITPELRREHEGALLQRYYNRVSELAGDKPGFAGYSLDRLWYDYRASLLQQGVAQVITSNLQGGNERGTELLEQLHMRPLLAAIDHNVGDILKDIK